MPTAASHEPKGTSMTGTRPDSASRELAYRVSDGLEVALLWHERDDVVSVMVLDSKTGDSFELVLGDNENPLAAFHHPYAYAAHRGIDYAMRTRDHDFAAAA
jgi:hypothetical protein